MAETIFDKPLADPPFYNGLDKTVGGFALDARQGKALSDQLTALNSKINNMPTNGEQVGYVVIDTEGTWSTSIFGNFKNRSISLVSVSISGIGDKTSVSSIATKTDAQFNIACNDNSAKGKMATVRYSMTNA